MRSLKLSAILLLLFCARLYSVSPKNPVPYAISGEIEMDEDASEYEIAGFKMEFRNLSDKNVVELTVNFYMFDEEGEPVSVGRSNVSLIVRAEIPAYETEERRISLDSYFYTVPDGLYTIDYLYVSKILYDDGSVWSDPYGLLYF